MNDYIPNGCEWNDPCDYFHESFFGGQHCIAIKRLFENDFDDKADIRKYCQHLYSNNRFDVINEFGKYNRYTFIECVFKVADYVVEIENTQDAQLKRKLDNELLLSYALMFKWEKFNWDYLISEIENVIHYFYEKDELYLVLVYILEFCIDNVHTHDEKNKVIRGSNNGCINKVRALLNQIIDEPHLRDFSIKELNKIIKAQKNRNYAKVMNPKECLETMVKRLRGTQKELRISQRKVLIQVYLNKGYSQKQIAEQLRLNESTISRYMHKWNLAPTLRIHISDKN